MIVTPYYNKPSQDGMRAHFLEVAAAVDVPIVVYNIPGRSVVDLAPETLERLCAEAPRVVGVKEATGNVMRCQELVRRMGDRLVVMSGDDALTLPMMSVGAAGVISVTSNVRPRETSLVTTLAREGQWDAAKKLHLALLELHGLLFVEPNPSPAKAALAAEGKMSAAVRGPLLPGTDGLKGRLVEALARLDAAAAKLAQERGR
jgi:4-hydroxy-tetrahydrodipicolinate synthase